MRNTWSRVVLIVAAVGALTRQTYAARFDP